MSQEKDRRREERLRATLDLVAPGRVLREGLERILRADSGGLIVLDDTEVDRVVSGGFRIDEDFTAQRLSELAKMDGAIILSDDVERIVRANVHLVPDPSIPTDESGTRHRTAERVARQTGRPVVAVSQSMRVVTLYVDSTKHLLEDIGAILTRANQALQTLERYKQRLDEVSGTPIRAWRWRTSRRCARSRTSSSASRWSGVSRTRSTPWWPSSAAKAA